MRMESEESRETAGVRRDRIKRLISCLLEVEEEVWKAGNSPRQGHRRPIYSWRGERKSGKDCTEGCLEEGKRAGGIGKTGGEREEE